MTSPSTANSAACVAACDSVELARAMNTNAPSGMLNNAAQMPGPGPAKMAVTVTAAKKRTKGAPVPVTGSSSSLSPNAAATITKANA